MDPTNVHIDKIKNLTKTPFWRQFLNTKNKSIIKLRFHIREK